MNSVLSGATVIFWDFDGVIKESVDVKTKAFENLFLPYGREISKRVRQHHESHSGVSRFEKIPIYLMWAGELITPAKLDVFCERFSSLVVQAVIDAPWVSGVRDYLLHRYATQFFVLVTATPQDEIHKILNSLEIAHCFREVHGAPTEKASAIKDVLSRIRCKPENALMIGDSDADQKAAQANSVPVLLRRTPMNQSIQAIYNGPMFEDLEYE